MRLVSALLFVALTGSTTLAEEAKPADPKPEVAKRRVPLRVVRTLPETRQVLLFDKNRGTHVVAEVGQSLEGYVVDQIDDDEVTLIAENGAEVILAAPAPEPTWRRRAAEGKATKPTSKPGKDAEPQPLDPYAEAGAPAAETPSAPSGVAAGEGGVRVASATDKAPTAASVDGAPADPYANATLDAGIAAFVDAVGVPPATAPAPATTAPAPATTAPATTAPATATPAPAPTATAKPDKPSAATTDAAAALAAAATGSPAPAPSVTVAPPAPAAAAPPANAFTISRSEVDAALADFGATAVTFDAKFVADGLRIDSIAEGTILGKLGLRKGDVLTAVDNQPLRGFDDAATLYARAGSARGATLSVMRGGKPLALRVTIR